MLRKYLAMLDDGHNYSSIEYYSHHKSGSKANRDDCCKEIQKRYGFKRTQELKIIKTELYNCR